MSTNIYHQHVVAFSRVSAFVILKDGEMVGTVAIKFPRDGAGRLYAYVHFLGAEMVRGYVGGYGYDKRSAAVNDAMKKIDPAQFSPDLDKNRADCEAFRAAVLDSKDGTDWADAFRKAGYDVLQAV
jgi:hypothetical protein